jgi:hypothetical protein
MKKMNFKGGGVEAPSTILLAKLRLWLFCIVQQNYIDIKQKSYEISNMKIARKVARSGAQHSQSCKVLILIVHKNGFMQRKNHNFKNKAATLTTVHMTVLAEYCKLV